MMNFIAKSLVVLTVLCAMQLSAYQIIVSQDATPAEKTAASELSYYLPQLSEAGEAVPVVTVRDESLGAALHVGQSEEALAALGLGAWSELKPDEVCYRVDASGDMWIAGDRPRGTLYAVYEFLEREYGVGTIDPAAAGSMNTDYMTAWTLEQYRMSMRQEDVDRDFAWSEEESEPNDIFEKSIVGSIAKNVIVGVKKEDVEMTIIMDLKGE